MRNPETVFWLVLLCGLHAHLSAAAGETRKLTDLSRRPEEHKQVSGEGRQVTMSQVAPGERLKEKAPTNQRGSERGTRASGVKPTAQVSPGGVKGLHLSLAGVGQVRAMWMNPIPFTDPSHYKPRCVYTVFPTEVRAAAAGRAYTYTAGKFNATLNEAVMTYGPRNVPVTINYQCGDDNYGMSPPYNVTLQPTTVQKSKWSKETQAKQTTNHNVSKVASKRPCTGETCVKGGERLGKVALIADMGIEEDLYTVRSLRERADRRAVDLVLHAGDVSYADDFGTSFRSGDGNNSWVWVEYMTSLQDVTARVPYMTVPGNHEEQFDFAAYRNWLHMPGNESGSSSPYYYSFDYLGVHFVGISTEHDLRGNSTQHRWLEQDLRTADGNRAEVPWILVFGHRPLYCSSAVFWTTRCTVEAQQYRRDLEELFQRYRVDVYVCGHDHQYERSWPVAYGSVTAQNYSSPAATVHIVTGAAGNPEGNEPLYVPEFLAPWRAGHSPTLRTGWTLMEVNSTALAFSYIHSADPSRAVDSFTITRDTK